MVSGTFQFLIAEILSGSVDMPSAETTYHRYNTLRCINLHLSVLIFDPWSFSRVNAKSSLSKCSSKVFDHAGSVA